MLTVSLSKSRLQKRSIVDSEEESGNSSAGPSKKQKVATKASKSKGKEASPFMLSSGEDDDDFNDGEMDWDEAIQVADKSQTSKKGKGPVKPTASAKSKAAPKKTATVSIRLSSLDRFRLTCCTCRNQPVLRYSRRALISIKR